MRQVTKGVCCPCGHAQNVTVAENVLELFCPKCWKIVKLGEALGLTAGQAIVGALIVWAIFG